MTRRERQAETSKRFRHIGDVVALTGLSADALRAWERVGLLTPQRSAGGVRQYTEDDVARIRLIARTLQRGGFSRAAVAMLLQSGDLQPDAADYAPGPARARPASPRARAADTADEWRSDRQILAAIARISDALASGRAIEEVLEVICAETCWAFGVSDATIWLAEPFPAHSAREPETQTTLPHALVVVAASGQHHSSASTGAAAPRIMSLDDQRFPPTRAFLTRRSLVVTTQDLSTRAHPELEGMLPGAAVLSMPLLAADGVALGVLVLQEASNIERFSADDLERIRLFAAHAALAIQTARLHVAIHAAQMDADDQRARWQSAVEDLPALVCMCDTALRITYVSPTCQVALGWPAAPRSAAEADPIGQSGDWITDQGFFWLDDTAHVTDSLPPDALPLPQALRERHPVHDIMVRHRRADGTERLITWDAAPMPAASGQLLGAIAFGRDVTAERRLRARETSLAAVTQAASRRLASESVEQRAVRILTALVENMPTPPFAATLYLWDDQAGALKRVCDVGTERAGAHTPALPTTPHHPWWLKVAADPLYSAHDRDRPRWLHAIGLASWKASGIRAWATVPLRTSSALVGALVIGLGAPHVWDAAERAWLEACAAALTMAVENGQLLSAVGRGPQV